MNFEEAKALLQQCTRSELRDHAFGDREIYFTKDSVTVAEGYSGSGIEEITIFSNEDGEGTYFSGAEATALLEVGAVGSIERNDSTGPDEFVEGQCMPGLTLDGVKVELALPKDYRSFPMFRTRAEEEEYLKKRENDSLK